MLTINSKLKRFAIQTAF